MKIWQTCVLYGLICVLPLLFGVCMHFYTGDEGVMYTWLDWSGTLTNNWSKRDIQYWERLYGWIYGGAIASIIWTSMFAGVWMFREGNT